MADGRSDRERIVLAVLAGVFVALVFVLIVVVLTRDGEDVEAATTTTTTAPLPPPTSTLPPTTTTQPPATTTTTAPLPPPTSTLPPTTTTQPPATTTTAAPFTGDTDWKTCTASGGFADHVTDIRFAQREGFTRVVFDFAGGIPGCNVGYADPHTLAVIVYPIDTADPFAAGIFDGTGRLQIGTNSVNRVTAGGMGGGSGEWEFTIDLAGTRDFHVFTLGDPSRVAIDIED